MVILWMSERTRKRGTLLVGQKRMGSFRTYCRPLARLAVFQGCFLAGSCLLAEFGVDSQYKAHVRRAVALDPSPPPVWRSALETVGLVRKRQHVSESELECLRAVVSLFNLNVHERVIAKLMPDVILSDPWFTLRGALELRDAWIFLSFLASTSAPPKVRELKKNPADPLRFIINMRTEYTLRFVGITLSVDSSVLVKLAELGKLRRIESIEHRWFDGGPIAGTISYPDTFLARGADALRRVDGFLLSIVMSADHAIANLQ